MNYGTIIEHDTKDEMDAIGDVGEVTIVVIKNMSRSVLHLGGVDVVGLEDDEVAYTFKRDKKYTTMTTTTKTLIEEKP